MSPLSCGEIEELLPWFLHGSLAPVEHRAVEEHLAGCSACRSALLATREASALFARHATPQMLVDRGLGLPLEESSRAALELHLAHCESCREELRLVESERPDSGERPVRTAAEMVPRGWRTLALAATVVAAVSTNAWLRTHDATPAPQGSVALVELLPESSRTRGAAAELEVVDRSHATTLLLITDRAETFDDVRVRITAGAEGAPLWTGARLAPATDGAYAIWIPAGALPAGEVVVELSGRSGAEWSLLDRYRLTLVP